MVFDGQDCAEDDRNNVALKLIANWSTGVKGAPMPRALHLRTAAFRTRMREIKNWRKCSKVFIHVDFSFDQRIWEYEVSILSTLFIRFLYDKLGERRTRSSWHIRIDHAVELAYVPRGNATYFSCHTLWSFKMTKFHLYFTFVEIFWNK